MIRIILILLLLVLSACDNECIEPGMGISSSDIKVEVPVFIEGATAGNKFSQWVDSNVLIKADEQVSVDVKGAINLCADTPKRVKDCANSKICSKKIVPAVFCSDGSVPDYSGADKEKVKATDYSVICAHSGGTTSRDGYYIDTGINVDPGDQLKFNLVPSQVISIDNCHNISAEVTQYIRSDLESYLTSFIKKNNNKVPDMANKIDDIINHKLYTVCESGVDFIKLTDELNLKVGPFKGKKFEVYVNNSFTPLGNKAYTYDVRQFSKKVYWIPGSLADARDLLKHNEYDYSCDAPHDLDLLRFNTYDVNYRCGNICNISGKNCASTLRYKWKTKPDQTCVKELGTDKCRALAFPVEKWADMLIARVGGENGNMASNPGQQCLPNNDKNADCMSSHSKQEDNSLQLEKNYTVIKDVSAGSKVSLGISDCTACYFDNTGGYHVRVDRSCGRHNGKDLYMYIGDSPGAVAPGDPGTEKVMITFEGCKNNTDSSCVTTRKLFIINDGSQPGKEGKVYFGIKGAVNSDTVETGYNDKDNKYTVVIYQTKWNPIFSEFFTLVRNLILGVLYGLPQDGKPLSNVSSIDIANAGGIIPTTYKNIIKNGLIQFVQAVLVLYIASSGISFMLGLMQKTQMELIIRVLKIGFVLAVISPDSWDFFGVTLFNLFVKGVDQLASFFSGVVGGDDAFAFLDPTVGALLTSEFWKRLTSIMWSGPVGFLSFFLLLWGIWAFLSAVVGAIIAYLMSIIALALLLSLTPLFIIAILFKVTKPLFDGWIKMLLSISIMPIILFSTLAFLHQLMMSAFYQINNFSACRGCIMDISFKIGPTEFGFCPIKLLVPSSYVYSYDYQHYINQIYATSGENFFGLPFNLTAMIVFVLSAFAMKVFVGIADNMSKDIAGSMEPNLLRASMGATQGLLSVIGQDDQTQQMRKQALSSDARKGANEVEFRAKPGTGSDQHIDKEGKGKEGKGKEGGAEGGGKDGDARGMAPSSAALGNTYEEAGPGAGGADEHIYDQIIDDATIGSQDGGDSATYAEIPAQDAPRQDEQPQSRPVDISDRLEHGSGQGNEAEPTRPVPASEVVMPPKDDREG